MFSNKFLGLLLVGALSGGALVDAAPRRLSDLGEANSLTDKRFDSGNSTNPRGDLMMGDERIHFQEWHGSYSSIGEKRMDAFKQRGGSEFRSNEVAYDMKERQEARISLESDKRKLANVQNWNTVRDNVMSHKFSGTEMDTPDARQFSEMVDEVSLRDINRIMFMKNSTDAGIPVQRAGSSEGPALSSEQQRVMARMKGGESVAVGTYKEQGARQVGQTTGPKEEPGFFESLFDW
ncbi:MAG: hypothetical protein ACQKBV_03115 [Puniceicoccales bacterium]